MTSLNVTSCSVDENTIVPPDWSTVNRCCDGSGGGGGGAGGEESFAGTGLVPESLHQPASATAGNPSSNKPRR